MFQYYITICPKSQVILYKTLYIFNSEQLTGYFKYPKGKTNDKGNFDKFVDVGDGGGGL